jgi:hypothetical protein
VFSTEHTPMRDSPRAAFLFVLVYVPWCLCAKLESAAAASAATAAVATPGAQVCAQCVLRTRACRHTFENAYAALVVL